MDTDEGVFKDGTPNITSGNVVANLLGGGELPLLLAVESGDRDATRNVDSPRDLGDASKRALDTIVNTVQQTGTELDGQRLAGAEDGVADSDTSYTC